MKKLYRKGTVHPSPSPSPSSSSPSHFLPLSTLPATILALVTALSVSDKEVLAYLLSCTTTTTPFDFDPSKSSSSPKKHKKHYTRSNSSNNGSSNSNNGHVTCFTCYCFNCYTTYWARWDSSPNRQLIHEIIDALEENLLAQKKKKQGVNKKEKKKNLNNVIHNDSNGVNEKYEGSVRVNTESSRVGPVEDDGGNGQLGDDAEEKQGIVRKMVSFVWGSVWG